MTLRLECVECKYRTQKALKRCKHFELGGDKKRKVCLVERPIPPPFLPLSLSTPPAHASPCSSPIYRVLSSSKLSGFCFCKVVVRGPAWSFVGHRLAESVPAAFWLLNEKATRRAGLLLLANTGDFAFIKQWDLWQRDTVYVSVTESHTGAPVSVRKRGGGERVRHNHEDERAQHNHTCKRQHDMRNTPDHKKRGSWNWTLKSHGLSAVQGFSPPRHAWRNVEPEKGREEAQGID